MLTTGDNPVSGTLSATTSAAALGSQVCSAVLVQNDPGSSVNLLIGDATHQYFSLKAGQACTIPCGNVSQHSLKECHSLSASNPSGWNF